MPLKIIDLATIESYKKALKQDASKINAQGDTRFWVYRDVELPTAAGKKQKLPAFLTLLDDHAIRPALKGAKLICTGTCAEVGGKISFEPTQGKVPYNLLKTSVPLMLGKMVLIPSNVNPDSDDEGDAETAASPPQKAAGPEGALVNYRRALVQFAQAKSVVHSQIGALKSAIVSKLPAEAAFAKELEADLNGLNDELQDVVDQAIAASSNAAAPANDKIRTGIRKYLTELSSNPLVRQAETNPFGVQVTIGKTLGEALTRIQAAMPK